MSRPKKLFDRIREVVKTIPSGKVVTYGDVARMVGLADARKVGWALHGNTDNEIPCHRVVKQGGFLAKSYQSPRDPLRRRSKLSEPLNFFGPDEQKKLLEQEGVEFTSKYQVDMSKYKYHARLGSTAT